MRVAKKFTVGLLAGEASGDNLGEGLMRSLSQQIPAEYDVEFVGIGGEKMIAAGLNSLFSINELSVNGFKEPILKLPSLFRLLRDIGDEMLKREVDVFIGIDFNVFNFLLEGRLKKHGLLTAHYVSPSVYAWRRGRTKRVAKVADMVFCLYPFEPKFYADTAVEPVFVGHPLANEIDPERSSEAARQQARAELKVDVDKTVIAVLPGSRGSEIDLMLPPFIGAMERLRHHFGDIEFLIPYPTERLKAKLAPVLDLDFPVRLVSGGARQVLQAADGAMVKSGTSTLEAMLLRRPMVVSYRLGTLSYKLAMLLVRTPYVALPNILLGRAQVPELLQEEGTPEALAAALIAEMEASRSRSDYFSDFDAMHDELRRDANATAAQAVLRLAGIRDL